MPYLRPFPYIKKFLPGRQTSVLYAVFCMLLSTFLCIILSSFSAGSTGLDPGSMEGLTAGGGWAATYGGSGNDRAYFIQQTMDGGYIVAGWTDSFGVERDVWVLKLRPDGTVEWQKTYGGDNSDEAKSIHQTRDGGYIVAGNTISFGAGELWVLKLGPDGIVEWQKTYGGGGGDWANSVQQTADGGYIVAGETKSFGAGEADVWVLKLRPDGTVEWEKTYGGEEWDLANSIQQTRDGGYIAAGYTSSFVVRGEETPDLWVLKLRPDGSMEWQKTYGGENFDEAESIHQTRDGGYIVAGHTQSFGAGSKEIMDLWVLKLRPDGSMEWQKTYGEVYWDLAKSIQQTGDGGYIVAGDTGFSARGDLWVLKLGPNGSVEWQKAYGGISSESAYSIQQTRDGGYIVAGDTSSFGAGEVDFWVLKLEPDGSINPSCNFIKDTSVSGKDSTATVRSIRVRYSNANPQDSSATVMDTKVSANILCP